MGYCDMGATVMSFGFIITLSDFTKLGKHYVVKYSLSNVILADEKSTLFHQYLRYNHKCGTIVFSIPSAIISLSHIASLVSAKVCSFEYVTYS